MDLSPQSVPPTLVTFLLSNCTIAQDVFTRTVLSLAQDGWLEILPQDQNHPGPGSPTLVRIARDPDWDRLSALEGLAFERIRTAMRDQPATPLSVLTSNDGQDESWSPRFNQAVIDAARAQILADFRIHPAFAGPLNSLITIAAGAAIAVTAHV